MAIEMVRRDVEEDGDVEVHRRRDLQLVKHAQPIDAQAFVADDATRAYDAEDWTKAFNDASAAQAEAQPPLKQRAAFLAGLAAHRQGRFDEARSRFIAAESSDDPKTAGDAKVMLGDLLTKEGKYAAAAAKYDQAAEPSGAALVSSAALAFLA